MDKIKLLLEYCRARNLKFSSNLLPFLSHFICYKHSMVPERSICTCAN